MQSLCSSVSILPILYVHSQSFAPQFQRSQEVFPVHMFSKDVSQCYFIYVIVVLTSLSDTNYALNRHEH